jgi:hypothetical protein
MFYSHGSHLDSVKRDAVGRQAGEFAQNLYAGNFACQKRFELFGIPLLRRRHQNGSFKVRFIQVCNDINRAVEIVGRRFSDEGGSQSPGS